MSGASLAYFRLNTAPHGLGTARRRCRGPLKGAEMASNAGEVDVNTTDVNHYIREGRQRAPFFRYFRFNLPRLTRLLLVIVLAVEGGCAWFVAATAGTMFPYAPLVLGLLVGLTGVFVVITLCTRWHVWDLGMVPAVVGIFCYFGALRGEPPYVWNGGSLAQAAAWNCVLFAGLVYVLLYWANSYGIVVAAPDNQNFTD